MLLENARAFDHLATASDVWDHAQRSLADAGLTCLIYLTVDESWQNPTLLTNIPSLYAGADPTSDPFLSHCCHSYDITLTGPGYLPDYDYLPDTAKAFITAARKTGFETGLGIPMRLLGSPRFGGFNIGTGLDRATFERDILPQSEALRTFCLLAHRRLEEIDATAPPDPASELVTGRTRMIAPDHDTFPDLTPREREIAYLVAQGFSRKECARLCALSPHTVADHLKAVYRKMGVNDRVALSNRMRAPNAPAPLG
ncbi:MAG: helix-turn-helix transcriptional regulator [Pseudomonadota bacterium]